GISSGSCSLHIKCSLPESFARRPDVRVLPLRHRLNIRKGRQGFRRIQIIDNREVLVQGWKDDNGQTQPGVLHGEHRILKRLVRLLGLNLSPYNIAMRNLASLLLLLADLQETRRVLGSLLRGRVSTLGGKQPVVISGNS